MLELDKGFKTTMVNMLRVPMEKVDNMQGHNGNVNKIYILLPLLKE
jgi:hypothetical protein